MWIIKIIKFDAFNLLGYWTNTDASILVSKFRPERTGFNMCVEYTRLKLTFLALKPWQLRTIKQLFIRFILFKLFICVLNKNYKRPVNEFKDLWIKDQNADWIQLEEEIERISPRTIWSWLVLWGKILCRDNSLR